MPKTIRFHLDENCDPRIAVGLRMRGVDVTTTVDANLRTASDEKQLAHALQEGRFFVTQDDDFLAQVAAGAEAAGLAYFAHQSRSIGQVVRALLLIWEIYEPDEVKNRIEFL